MKNKTDWINRNDEMSGRESHLENIHIISTHSTLIDRRHHITTRALEAAPNEFIKCLYFIVVSTVCWCFCCCCCWHVQSPNALIAIWVVHWHSNRPLLPLLAALEEWAVGHKTWIETILLFGRWAYDNDCDGVMMAGGALKLDGSLWGRSVGRSVGWETKRE